MPYFVEYFDVRPGVTTEQVAEACRRVTERWARHWPTNKDLGLYRRKHGIGAGPMYYWVWELPDVGSVQEWDKEFSIDEVREAVDELRTLIERESWAVLERVQGRPGPLLQRDRTI